MTSGDPNKRIRFGGGALLVLGLAFTIIGASGDRSFYWIGVPFLVSGLVSLGYEVLARSKTVPTEQTTPNPHQTQQSD